MNANTLAEIERRHAEGEGAAQIAAALAADPRFAQRITARQLRGIFAGSLIGIKLQAAAVNEELPFELRAGVSRVLMIVSWEDGYVDTLHPEHAAALRIGMAALVPAVLTEAEAAELLALGGGPFYDPLTPEQVQAYLDAEAAREAEQALRQRAADAYNAVVLAIDEGERDWTALAAVFAETEE